jgi:hypothetical protein
VVASLIAATDVTQVASLIAAGTALVAAIAGIVNVRLAILRDRTSLKVVAREWRAGPGGSEDYIEVLVANAGLRPISVRAMGLLLSSETRSWREADGTSSPTLPCKLEDGEIATMAWLRDELGREFNEGAVRIVGCFALDGRGNEVNGPPPHA